MRRIPHTARPAPANGRWLIKGLLRKRGVAVMFGPPGTGKTAEAVDLACHVATGGPWRGHKVAGGLVVYVAGEDEDGVLLALSAWEKTHEEIEAPAAVEVIAGPLDITPSQKGKAPKDLADLVAEIDAASTEYGTPVALIVVDTLASVWRDESNEGFTDLLGICRELADRYDAAVLLVHHTGKDPDRDERGGSALRGGTDVSLKIVREGDVGAISAVKVRGAPDGMKWGFRLQVVELGKDEDGDTITACVAAPAKAPISTIKLKSENHRNVLRAVVMAFQIQTNGSATVPVETVRSIAYQRMPQARNSKRTIFDRATVALQEKGYIDMRNGHISLAPDIAIPSNFMRRSEDVDFQTH